ncbi:MULTISPECIES: hypothetical protein [unclassified Mesorhizobium]|uniref:hypothetical protein n=1 Tax=unclassified Mesorhizobium TaxID=325217 RepID=UPI0019294DCE|nr:MULTISPECIES: hypothetical protein [unclassified Mesorhizobium]
MERTAKRKGGGCGFDERQLMPEPALMWRIVHAVHHQHGRSTGIIERRMTTSSAIDASACVSWHGRRRLRRRDVADIPPLAPPRANQRIPDSAFDLAMLVRSVNARAALMAIITASVSIDEMDLLDRRKTIEQVAQQGRLMCRRIERRLPS